jgi:hypothetical protein
MGVGTVVGYDAFGCRSLSGESTSAGQGCETCVPIVSGRVAAGDVGDGAGEGPIERGERLSEAND